MKKTVLITAAVTGLALASFGQGIFQIDNEFNASNDAAATTGGLFWVKPDASAPVKIATDFNIWVVGGSSSTSLGTLVSDASSFSSLILRGAGNGAFSLPGTYTDSSGENYIIPGSTPLSSGFLQIFAWTGTATTWAAAQNDPNALVGQSAIFTQSLVNVGSTTFVPSMTTMPAVVLAPVPEPGTFALAGLGAAALMIFRRRK